MYSIFLNILFISIKTSRKTTQQNHHQNLDKRKNRLPFETAANIESRSILEEDRREIIDHTCTLDSDHVVYG